MVRKLNIDAHKPIIFVLAPINEQPLPIAQPGRSVAFRLQRTRTSRQFFAAFRRPTCPEPITFRIRVKSESNLLVATVVVARVRQWRTSVANPSGTVR
jgi:hypothetical protein